MKNGFDNLKSASHRCGGFTLVELLVAAGLMAILLTMIATIFMSSTNAVRMARATVEIHRSAAAVLHTMEQDLTATEYCSYGQTQGYFALSKMADRDNADPADPNQFHDGLTFTTLAPQLGSNSTAPEVIQQLALVRYQLVFDGGSVTIPKNSTPRPTYTLVKRVRFPRTDYTMLDMDEFPSLFPINGVYPFYPAGLKREAPNGYPYAATEPIGLHVLSMRVRMLCEPTKEAGVDKIRYFVEAGKVTDASNTGPWYLKDSSRDWEANHFTGLTATIIGGTGTGQSQVITNSLLTDKGRLEFGAAWTTALKANSSIYRVDTDAVSSPTWCTRADSSGDYLGLLTRPPAMIEITLEMTDERAVTVHTFTQRLYIPASERTWP